MPVVPAPASELIPRMLILLLAPPELCPNVTPGVNRATSANDLMPFTSIVFCEKALMLKGTREIACAWRVAVTMISETSLPDADAPGADALALAGAAESGAAAGVCATAGMASTAAPAISVKRNGPSPAVMRLPLRPRCGILSGRR